MIDLGKCSEEDPLISVCSLSRGTAPACRPMFHMYVYIYICLYLYAYMLKYKDSDGPIIKIQCSPCVVPNSGLATPPSDAQVAPCKGKSSSSRLVLFLLRRYRKHLTAANGFGLICLMHCSISRAPPKGSSQTAEKKLHWRSRH